MTIKYDYDFQCCVENGIVKRCGHPANFRYKDSCFACLHAGEPIADHRRKAGYPNAEYTAPESVDPQQRYDADGKLPIFDRLAKCLERFEDIDAKIGEFMFMGCYTFDGKNATHAATSTVAAFKHRNTRRYVHIDFRNCIRVQASGVWAYAGTTSERLALRRALGISLAPASTSPPPAYTRQFREEDCGGAFDGFGVISDADPGL